MSWGLFLGAIAAPLAKRVLVALGFGLVSYAGYSALVSQLQGWIQSNLGSLGADVYALFALIGLVDSIGIWLAAFSALAALSAFSRLQRMTA